MAWNPFRTLFIRNCGSEKFHLIRWEWFLSNRMLLVYRKSAPCLKVFFYLIDKKIQHDSFRVDNYSAYRSLHSKCNTLTRRRKRATRSNSHHLSTLGVIFVIFANLLKYWARNNQLETTEANKNLFIVSLCFKTLRKNPLKRLYKSAAIRRFKNMMGNFMHSSKSLTPNTLITVQ